MNILAIENLFHHIKFEFRINDDDTNKMYYASSIVQKVPYEYSFFVKRENLSTKHHFVKKRLFL
jgi:hypothetical protein